MSLPYYYKMSNTSESYINNRLAAIEQEFTNPSPARLLSLLGDYLNKHANSLKGERAVEDIPVRPGWTIDIMDSEAIGAEEQQNEYGHKVETPITLAFWPQDKNNVSSSPEYYDGPKLHLNIGSGGVFDHFAKKWLLPEETTALLNDIQLLLGHQPLKDK